jgi:hypothetical protein
MTFGLLTISYGRIKVLQLWLASIRRLRAEIGIDFPAIVVGDAEHKELCESYGVFHVSQQNHPATAKFNTGTQFLMEHGVDYVCITGSDDVLSTDLLRNLIVEMEKGTDLIGIDTIYFYGGDGKHKGCLRKLIAKNQILGVARCIKRSIIEKVGGRPWNREASWGMDGICLRNILPHIKTRALVQGICTDVKSRENLNKITLWLGKIDTASDPNIFYDTLGEEEKLILSQI